MDILKLLGSVDCGWILHNIEAYVLFNKRAGVFIRFRSARGFRPSKTRPASLSNGFKHDHKFNRYTALLVFFI
jgi:hypothetical protein